MSPRRSSRARSSQQPTAPSQANSSSSSTTTLKDSKNVRSGMNRSVSEGRVSTQRSESIEDADAMSRSEQSAPRRSRRGAEQEKEPLIKQSSIEDDDNEAIEDDVTRCICGHAEYPGPSQGIREQYGAAGMDRPQPSRHNTKSLTTGSSTHRRHGQLLRAVRQLPRLATWWLHGSSRRINHPRRVLL